MRWTLYKNFLEAHRDEYNQVLLTDVRDVIFQGDIFKANAHESQEGYLSYATEHKIIEKDQIFNSSWIKKFFGNDEYEKLKKYKAVCVGTVCGTMNEILIFINKMEELLKKSTFWGAEQAIANYLIYEKRLPIKNIIESSVIDGEILTTGTALFEEQNGKILNRSGKIPAVVHQYDRDQNRVDLVNKMYRLINPSVPRVYGDFRSELDITSVLMKQGKISKALNLLVEMIDKYPNSGEWKKSFDKLIDMLKVVTTIKQRTLNVDILEQAICGALMLSLSKHNSVDINQIEIMLMILMTIKKQQRTIFRPFAKAVGDFMWEFAKIFDKNDKLTDAKICLDRLKEIEYNFDTEQYLLSAKINRLLGNAEVSMKDYKKALKI